VKGVRVVKPLNYRPVLQGSGDAGAGRSLRLAALRAQALRVAIHAFLRGLLVADKVRLRQASRPFLEPDSHRADDARRGAEEDREPAYTAEDLAQDFEYVATKLDLSIEQLREIMAGANKSYRDYRNAMTLIDLGTRVMRAIGMQRAVMR
jgi:hypothetical protein